MNRKYFRKLRKNNAEKGTTHFQIKINNFKYIYDVYLFKEKI